MQILSDAVLDRDPNAPLKAATKQYVDANAAPPEVYIGPSTPPAVQVLWVDVDEPGGVGSGGGGGASLTYHGDYVPGTYNDGDIVVGADGITYMCVVDGTTTAPEAWPTASTAVWSRWSGTQAEYDALGTYDPNTLYIIV